MLRVKWRGVGEVGCDFVQHRVPRSWHVSSNRNNNRSQLVVLEEEEKRPIAKKTSARCYAPSPSEAKQGGLWQQKQGFGSDLVLEHKFFFRSVRST